MNPDRFMRNEHRSSGGVRRRSLRISREQERRVAGRLGGRVQPGSGAGAASARSVGPGRARKHGRGDVDTSIALLELKTTDNASISVKQSYLIKVTRQASRLVPPQSPGFVLSFPVMPDRVDCDWILLPVSVLEALVARAGGSIRKMYEVR